MARNQILTFPAAGEVELVEQDRPTPDSDEVLVECTRSAVSTGTELTVMSGEFPDDSRWARYGTYPFETGYSAVGEVVEVGADVEESWLGRSLALGQPHARYHTLRPDRATPVPDIPAEEAAFFTMAGIAMNGVRRGRVTWGETAVLFGCGLIGQLAARFCRIAGARPVVGFDIADERLEYLPDRPGYVAANPAEVDGQDTVRDAAHDRLADVVFEVTGAPDAIPGQFDVLKEPLGRLVVLSSPKGETALDLHDRCNSPSTEIIGAHNSSHPPVETPQTPWTRQRHFELFFDLVADGELDIGSLVSHRISPEEAPAFYEGLLEDRSEAMGVVIEWE